MWYVRYVCMDVGNFRDAHERLDIKFDCTDIDKRQSKSHGITLCKARSDGDYVTVRSVNRKQQGYLCGIRQNDRIVTVDQILGFNLDNVRNALKNTFDTRTVANLVVHRPILQTPTVLQNQG